MRKAILRMYVGGAVALLGCAGWSGVRNDHALLAAGLVSPQAYVARSGMRASDDSEADKVRAATSAFKSLDAAVAAGYSRDGGTCLAQPTQGGMGYHHTNPKLVDDKVDLEHPEILVYNRTPSGEYVLNGVEYFVPFSVRPGTAEPPTVMGQKLKAYEQGKFWYLHAWVWLDNPSGLFADWNPKVICG